MRSGARRVLVPAASPAGAAAAGARVHEDQPVNEVRTPLGALARTPNSALKSGARRVPRAPSALGDPTPGSATAAAASRQQAARRLGSSAVDARERALRCDERLPDDDDDDRGSCAGENEELAALAFASLRSGARRAAVESAEFGGICHFDGAPPSTGGSVVRLAAVRATVAQRQRLGLRSGESAKVVTPVRRSARPTRASALPPVSDLLEDVGYTFTPNAQLLASVGPPCAEEALGEMGSEAPFASEPMDENA